MCPNELCSVHDTDFGRSSVHCPDGTLISTSEGTIDIKSFTNDAANELTNLNGVTVSYDQDGKTINDGIHAYSWDARSQLAAIDSGGTATFAYDPFGRRSSKLISGVGTTGFLYDGLNPVQELAGTSPSANLLEGGIDEEFQRTDSTGVYSFLRDALGSTVTLTDASGGAQTQYTYDPFGGSMQSGPSTSSSYAYTGRELDTAGLYFYRARYYSPAIGRFISEDPLEFNAGLNFYQYVDDSPLDFTDFSGPDKCQGREHWPISPRLAMGLRGGSNLLSNFTSLAGNLESGNGYGLWRSFFGMMASDSLIYGAIEGGEQGLQTGTETSQLFSAFATRSGITLKLFGASDATASEASAAESTLWGLQKIPQLGNGDALKQASDAASIQRATFNIFRRLPELAGCAQ